MRKALIAIGVVAAIVVVVALLAGGGSGGSGYVVRGIFDSGGFMVKGEEVRVAGATVGEIEAVGVTMPGEIDSYKNGKPQAVPGVKEMVSLRIDRDVLDFFQEDGPGWQERINAALRKAAGK